MFKKAIYVSSIIFAIVFGMNMHAANIDLASTATVEKAINSNSQQEIKYKKVAPLQLVENPQKYLDKTIKMSAKFDKFATIGLDYPPINKDAKTYISFLIKRDNVIDYNIPLSELKLILKREYAEKELVKLETGDSIEIYGKVFSTVLGDPWVEVSKVEILTTKKETVNE